MANEVELPECKYGEKCYRRNPDHLRQFWHPSASGSGFDEPAIGPVNSLADRRSEDQPGSSTLSKQVRGLSPEAIEDIEEDAAEAEWEIDAYDGEIRANSDADEFAPETPALSNDSQSITRGSGSADAIVLLILVGVPGSGKSTFCGKLMSSAAQPWTRICQDIISKGKRGTKQQCLRQAEFALLERRSVVIDRCNIDKQQRQDFLQLAARLKVNCHAVVLNLPPSVCIQRALKRVAHEGGVHPGNAAPVINRVYRNRQLPSLNEGFFRITFCRTDSDVQTAIEEYRVLQLSKLLEPGMFGLMIKSESKPHQDCEGRQLASSDSSHKKDSPSSGNKEEGPSAQAGTGKQQGSKDYSSGEHVAGRSRNLSPVLHQNPGPNTLAFPSISTADFQFDHDKASTVLVESISDFLLKNQHTGLKLVLVDLSSKSHMISLVKRKATEKGIDLNQFTTFAGDITKIQSSGGPPCNVIANAANWRLKSGGGGVNAAIYKASGPEFEQATKKVATTLLPGTSIVVPVPASSPLRHHEGVTHVIHVLGPNMNPQRPNFLAGDYVEGCKILRNAYMSLFENFASVAQVKPVMVDNGKSSVDSGNMNQKPKLNAFQVLMQASKRKGEMAGTGLKRERGEKVRVVEDSTSSLRGDQTEGAVNEPLGQPNLPSEAGRQGSGSLVSTSRGDEEVQGNRSSGPQASKKVERRWDTWSLALYRVALHPDENRSSLLEVTDFAVVMEDLYPKAKRHVLVVSRTQGIDSLEDVRQDHVALLEHMHSLGKKYAASFLKEDSSLVFRLGYHSAPSMRQLHLHVISQDFNSVSLKHKKHWNSFTTPFFRDSLDVISEVKAHGQVDNCGPSAEKMLQDLELRCHRCRSVQPNMPRLKSHISTCTRPLSNSTHLITANSLNGS